MKRPRYGAARIAASLFLSAFCCTSLLLAQADRSLFQAAESSWSGHRWDEAVAHYRQVAERYPASVHAPRALIQVGVFLKYQRRWEEAVREYENAIALAPGSRDAQDAKTSIAAIHYFLEDYPPAVRLLQEVLAETRDWDQIKYCSYMLKDIRRRMALQNLPHRSSCGSSSLVTACQLMGLKVTQQELRQLLPSRAGGTSMADLMEAARAKGLDPHGVSLTMEQLRTVRKPAIALLRPGHYVVVTGAGRQGVDYIDPGERNTPQRKPLDEFAWLWTGRALMFGRVDRGAVVALLDSTAMRTLKGKVCYCCPPANLGDASENPCTEYDGHCLGSGGGPGMPGLLVNTVNLNLLVQDLDFFYGGRGPSVYLRRTYNADDPRDGPFGRSWTFNYNVTLAENPDHTVDVRRESGKIDHFVLGSNGKYTGPEGVYDTLSKNGDGSYSLELKRGKLTQQFSSRGILSRITDRNGNAVTLGYDSSGRLTSVTDSAGRSTGFTYGSNNKITAAVDPAGRRATYEYDGKGNLIRSVDMAGAASSYAYDSASYLTAVTTPKGVTRLGYDTSYEGYSLKSITDAAGNVRSYGTYTTDYQVRVVRPDGVATVYDNTFEGYTGSITDGLGSTTTFGYDSKGNRNAITDPAGRKLSLSYDARANITTITDALKNAIRLTYDSADRIVKVIDPLNRATQYTYDAKGNPTQVIDADNNTAAFSYDSMGQLTGFTDVRGNTTSFQYDSGGNVVRVTSPLAHSTSYGYDAVGRTISRTDAKGNLTRYAYDGVDRLTGVTYPDGSNKTFTHDCCGPATVVDASGTASFAYDTLNRLTQFTNSFGQAIRYAYDKASNLTALTYPDGKVVNYEYDGADRLVKVRDWLGNVTQYTYDRAGLLLSSNTANGPLVVRGYDGAGRLSSSTGITANGTLLATHNYTLDAVGNIGQISLNEPLAPALTSGRAELSYDKENRLVSDGANAYEHDALGNLTRISGAGGTTTLDYDWQGRLARVAAGGRTTQYQYDGLGNRIVKTADGATRRYVVNPNAALSQVLAETDASGAVVAYYVYGLGLISQVTAQGRPYFYGFDHLGNTLAVSDAAGTIVNAYAYDPFGNLADNSFEGVANPFRYVGRLGVMDDGNGLLYMRARYYAPGLGRFLTKDPWGSVSARSSYGYGLGNPLTWVDPTGLKPWWKAWGEAIYTFFTTVLSSLMPDPTGLGGVMMDENTPQAAGAIPVIVWESRFRKALMEGTITIEQYGELHDLLGNKKWDELKQRAGQCGLK